MSNHSSSTQNSSVSHSSKRSEMMRRKKKLNSLIRGTSGRSMMLFEGNSDTNSCVGSIDPPEDGTLDEEKPAPRESKFYGWGEDDSCYTESEPEPMRKDEDSVELYVAFPETDEREASITDSSIVSRNDEGTLTDVIMDDEYDSKRPWRKAPPAAKKSFLSNETGISSLNKSVGGSDGGTILDGKSKYVEEQSKQTMSSLSSGSRKRIVQAQMVQVKNKPKIGTVITTDENTNSHHMRERFLEQDHKSGSDVSELLEAKDALKRSQVALAGTIRRNDSLSSNSQRSHRTLDTNFTTSTPIYRKPEPFRPGPAFERKFTQTNRMISLGSFGPQYSCSTLGTRQSLTKGNQQPSFMTLEEGDERDEDEDDDLTVDPYQQDNFQGKEAAFPSNESRNSLSLHSLEEVEGAASTRRSSIASTIFSIDEESSMERFRSSRRQSRVSLSSLNTSEGSETFSATRRPSKLSLSSVNAVEGPEAFRSSAVSKESFASETSKDGSEELPSANQRKSNDIENPEVKENNALKETSRKIEQDASNKRSDLQKVDELVAEDSWDVTSNATNNTFAKQDSIVAKDDASNENSYEGGLDLLGQNRAEERNKLMAITQLMFPSDSDMGSLKSNDMNDPPQNTALRRSQVRLRRRSMSSLSGMNESVKRATTAFKRTCLRNRVGFSLAMLITVIILLAAILAMVLYNRMYNSNSPSLPPTSKEQVTVAPTQNPKSQKVDETVIIFQPIDSKPTLSPTYLPTKSSQPSKSQTPTLSPTMTASPTTTTSPTNTTSKAPTSSSTLPPNTATAPPTASPHTTTAPSMTGNTTKVSNQLTTFPLTNETISGEYDMVDQYNNKELDQTTSESDLALESKKYDPQQTRMHLRSPSPTIFTMWPTPLDTYTMIYPPPNKKNLRGQTDLE